MRAALLLCAVMASQVVAAPVEKMRLLSFELSPYIHADANGDVQGAAVEMVREIFTRIHVTPQLRAYPLARSLAMFESGQAEGIFTMKKKQDREAPYVFSGQPLFKQETVLFVRKDSPIQFRGDLQVLAGRAIGVRRGASYGELFDKAAATGLFGRLEFVTLDDSSFRKLLAGRIDAVISGRESGMATVRRLGFKNQVRVSGKPLEVTGSYLMFNKDAVDADFLRKLNAAMSAMRKDGSACRIRSKYGLP